MLKQIAYQKNNFIKKTNTRIYNLLILRQLKNQKNIKIPANILKK